MKKLFLLMPALLLTVMVSAQNDTAFVHMRELSDNFSYDMRYATPNNFLKEKVYDCDECVLRNETAQGLLKANAYFRTKGYRIRFFDCYRPLDVQKKMWEILPDRRYVASPAGRGSSHNRGLAVDLTLETLDGKILNMGTDFDHFGKEAHHDYTQLKEEVLRNRKLLKEGMEQAGFKSLRTEWWHYTYKSTHSYQPANWPLGCE